MKQEYALVVLAAGIGSRFGGVKQLAPVGPKGELLMEYSIHDAVEAGFRHIVFIIRKDIEQDFREVIGDRLEAVCVRRGVRVSYVFQELTDLPGAYTCPAGRTKPWGTVQALLTCREVVNGPFAVVNADDYYGKSVFRDMINWLKTLPENSMGQYALAGYCLKNTLSDFGGVTRGICSADEQGYLQNVQEVKNIRKTPQGVAVGEEDGKFVDEDSLVSMNLWAFTPDVFALLREGFEKFLNRAGSELTSELVISVLVDELLHRGQVSVRVLPTMEHWLGVTYQQDLPHVQEDFRALHDRGVYTILWEEREYIYG